MPADTRDRIVETARKLFWERGYHASGVAEILDRAGVNSGSLYYFFRSKEDLLAAVLDKYKELLEPVVLRPVFERIDDPIDRIFGVLDGYRQLLIQTRYRHGCPIGNLALEVAHEQPNARIRIAENFTGWRRAIEQCLADAGDRLPRNLDRERLALFVLTTMECAVMLARSYHNLEPYDAAIAQLRDYFDRLLAAGRAARRRQAPSP